MRGILLGLILAATLLGALTPGATVSAQPVDPDTAIRLAQRRIQRHPRDATAFHRLGDAYIQKARGSGDVSYFALAEQALRKALEIAPQSAGVWRHLAYVYSSRHEFDDAAAHARRAIDLNPGDADAHGVLGDAMLELGRYDEADAAYRKMVELDASLASYSRRSGLKSLRGDPAGAIEDLRLAIRAGKARGEPSESVAWALSQLGSDHQSVGELGAAEAAYTEALATRPNYYRALAGLGRVRAAQKRFAEAIDLYGKALAVIPLPEYAAVLGDIYVRIGQPEEARKQYDLVEYIGQLNSLNRALYNRELAMFYADHDMKLPRALELARKELTVRRDVYAWDLLAWALLKNGEPHEAEAAMQEALRLGTRDARLLFHAGMIYRALDRRDRARHALEQALATNPHFDVLQAEIAERALQDLRSNRPVRKEGG